MIIDRPQKGQIADLRALWKEAFGDSDSFLDVFFTTAYSPERCRCVTVDGEAVSALYWFDCEYSGERIAYLYAVATAENHRGHGYCQALLDDTHRHLSALGYEGVILSPGSDNAFEYE